MEWTKSSHSFSNSNCVEAAVTGDLAWHKAQASIGNGACVEMAGMVVLRDSKDPDGPRLAFGSRAWRDFIGACKAGEFDSLA